MLDLAQDGLLASCRRDAGAWEDFPDDVWSSSEETRGIRQRVPGGLGWVVAP
jgi:hypothetical protein